MKLFIATVLVIGVLLSMGRCYAQTRNSVAIVYSEQGKGTGFFVTRNLVMTNHHVVCDDNPYKPPCKSKVVIRYSLVKVRGVVVASDEDLDLALVFIRGKGPRPFRFCSSVNIMDKVEIWVYEHGIFNTKKGRPEAHPTSPSGLEHRYTTNRFFRFLPPGQR